MGKDDYLKENIMFEIQSMNIPPHTFMFDGLNMICLGISNKEDLINEGYSGHNQYIYVSDNTDLFEVFFVKIDDRIYLKSLRTRQYTYPPKKRIKKEESENI